MSFLDSSSLFCAIDTLSLAREGVDSPYLSASSHNSTQPSQYASTPYHEQTQTSQPLSRPYLQQTQTSQRVSKPHPEQTQPSQYAYLQQTQTVSASQPAHSTQRHVTTPFKTTSSDSPQICVDYIADVLHGLKGVPSTTFTLANTDEIDRLRGSDHFSAFARYLLQFRRFFVMRCVVNAALEALSDTERDNWASNSAESEGETESEGESYEDHTSTHRDTLSRTDTHRGGVSHSSEWIAAKEREDAQRRHCDQCTQSFVAASQRLLLFLDTSLDHLLRHTTQRAHTTVSALSPSLAAMRAVATLWRETELHRSLSLWIFDVFANRELLSLPTHEIALFSYSQRTHTTMTTNESDAHTYSRTGTQTHTHTHTQTHTTLDYYIQHTVWRTHFPQSWELLQSLTDKLSLSLTTVSELHNTHSLSLFSRAKERGKERVAYDFLHAVVLYSLCVAVSRPLMHSLATSSHTPFQLTPQGTVPQGNYEEEGLTGSSSERQNTTATTASSDDVWSVLLQVNAHEMWRSLSLSHTQAHALTHAQSAEKALLASCWMDARTVLLSQLERERVRESERDSVSIQINTEKKRENAFFSALSLFPGLDPFRERDTHSSHTTQSESGSDREQTLLLQALSLLDDNETERGRLRETLSALRKEKEKEKEKERERQAYTESSDTQSLTERSEDTNTLSLTEKQKDTPTPTDEPTDTQTDTETDTVTIHTPIGPRTVPRLLYLSARNALTQHYARQMDALERKKAFAVWQVRRLRRQRVARERLRELYNERGGFACYIDVIVDPHKAVAEPRSSPITQPEEESSAPIPTEPAVTLFVAPSVSVPPVLPQTHTTHSDSTDTVTENTQSEHALSTAALTETPNSSAAPHEEKPSEESHSSQPTHTQEETETELLTDSERDSEPDTHTDKEVHSDNRTDTDTPTQDVDTTDTTPPPSTLQNASQALDKEEDARLSAFTDAAFRQIAEMVLRPERDVLSGVCRESVTETLSADLTLSLLLTALQHNAITPSLTDIHTDKPLTIQTLHTIFRSTHSHIAQVSLIQDRALSRSLSQTTQRLNTRCTMALLSPSSLSHTTHTQTDTHTHTHTLPTHWRAARELLLLSPHNSFLADLSLTLVDTHTRLSAHTHSHNTRTHTPYRDMHAERCLWTPTHLAHTLRETITQSVSRETQHLTAYLSLHTPRNEEYYSDKEDFLGFMKRNNNRKLSLAEPLPKTSIDRESEQICTNLAPGCEEWFALLSHTPLHPLVVKYTPPPPFSLFFSHPEVQRGLSHFAKRCLEVGVLHAAQRVVWARCKETQHTWTLYLAQHEEWQSMSVSHHTTRSHNVTTHAVDRLLRDVHALRCYTQHVLTAVKSFLGERCESLCAQFSLSLRRHTERVCECGPDTLLHCMCALCERLQRATCALSPAEEQLLSQLSTYSHNFPTCTFTDTHTDPPSVSVSAWLSLRHTLFLLLREVRHTTAGFLSLTMDAQHSLLLRREKVAHTHAHTEIDGEQEEEEEVLWVHARYRAMRALVARLRCVAEEVHDEECKDHALSLSAHFNAL